MKLKLIMDMRKVKTYIKMSNNAFLPRITVPPPPLSYTDTADTGHKRVGDQGRAGTLSFIILQHYKNIRTVSEDLQQPSWRKNYSSLTKIVSGGRGRRICLYLIITL